MKLFVNREKGNNKILQIRGKDTNAIKLQLLLRIILEEQQFREQSTQSSDTIVKTKEYNEQDEKIDLDILIEDLETSNYNLIRLDNVHKVIGKLPI